MKFLTQQIISVLCVILISLAISGYRVSNYMTSQLYQAKEEQLIDYGHNMIDYTFERSDLMMAAKLLSREDIHIQVHLSDGRTIFPTYDQRNRSQLSKDELAQLMAGETLGLRSTQRYIGSQERVEQLTVYVPILYDRGPFPQGFLSLSTPVADLADQVKQIQTNIIQSFVIASVVALLIGIVYSMWQTQKIRRLQAATHSIMHDDYDLDLDLLGEDELSELARDFQQMSNYLQASNEEIERQELLRQEFMLDVMHEMRTPLTTMSGLLEGLEHGLIPEGQKQRSLELIQQETYRLTRLVNQHLDYEKIRTQQINLMIEPIEGHHLFEEIQTQMTVMMQEKHNQLMIDASEDLLYWADLDRLKQIILNLIKNANQFTSGDTIWLRGWMEDSQAVLQVEDHGIGIAPDALDLIWERFYKVDESRKNTRWGESGIGLSVVQSLVIAHHGTIEVTSQEGEGTIFTIYLPIRSQTNSQSKEQL